MDAVIIDDLGRRKCEYRGGCDNRFAYAGRKRFCDQHSSKAVTAHAARTSRRAEARTRTCAMWACDTVFTPADPRQTRCDMCSVISEVTYGGADGSIAFADRKVTPGGKIEQPRQAHFIGVDGEGTGRGKDHRYVLLGVGQEQREWPGGVQDITEIFEFLYKQFEANPGASFVGFFLGYDFNMWLRLLPRERAAMLLTEAGKAKRARKSSTARKLGPFPVDYQGWEFDMLATKRFKLRPSCEHRAERGKPGCGCKQKPWMYICDAGPFFQTSLLTAINPKSWREPIASPEEYAAIKRGKERRDSAVLDDDMRYYNRLENDILSRLMHSLDTGLRHANVHLKKEQWYGPGQAAQTWMRLGGKLDATTKAIEKLPKRIQEAAIATYYGGWFEIPVHGHIPGVTYEYDINSAYPSIAARLPCLCGKWRSGTGRPTGTLSHKWASGTAKTPRDRTLRMVHVIVTGKDKHLGPLPYRLETGHIRRPLQTEGWYWQHEIDAARRAGLVLDVHYLAWHEYQPCDHEPPLRQLEGLYQSRLRIGKDTPEGKAFKLVYNSVYGKLAQSLGEPVYANPLYASLITAGCRTMILNAIATHPARSAAVAMVATDGVYFLSPHPGLDDSVSEKLGEWSREEHHNLTTFKPGVYWDDKAREAIAKGEAPKFKSRGVSAAAFSSQIETVDKIFGKWTPDAPGEWPEVRFTAGFAQITVVQALQWTTGKTDPAAMNATYRQLAGRIQENKKLVQNSYPGGPTGKRHASGAFYDPVWRVYRTAPYPANPAQKPSAKYEKRFGIDENQAAFNEYATPDGPVGLSFRQTLGVG